MKMKLACGWPALLVLCVLLASLPARADGDALKWVEIDNPGLGGNIVVSPSEVSEIAVGRRGTIYAIDSENSKVYRSVDAGATWEDITSHLLAAGAGLPASKIAVSPDSASTVAVATNSGTKVYLSTDAGATWTGTNVPSLAGTIQAITISRQYTEAEGSLREIAIGTASWGDDTTTGQVWVFQWGARVSAWRNQGLTGEISAIAYSPNYQRDSTIILVASTGNDVAADYRNKTWLYLGKRDSAAGTTSWDALSGYPVEIATASSPSAGDAAGVSISSSLAIPSNYFSREENSRQLFVSYDRGPDASDDVYRLDDTNVYRLNASGGANINISSIAYYGTTTSGKLLAGDVSPVPGSSTVQVRRTSNPFDPSPTWHLASTAPSGPGNAKVSWSPEGDLAYCGTSHNPGIALDEDESAFSMSSDDGDSWQQLSLVDTTSITLSDIAPAPDSETLFAVTYSSFGPEGIWRTASTRAGIGEYWSRQLTMDTTSDSVILRLSVNYASDYTIYAAEVGGNLIMMSHNRGNSWHERHAPGAVIDMAVADEDTVYVALPGGCISKSINGAWFWENPIGTALPNINMLSIAPKETILVGGKNGGVAYSTDGGTSFTETSKVGTGDVWVTADAKYDENSIIYAGTGNKIYRLAVGASATWEPIRTLRANQQISGLEVAAGVLYGAWYDTVAGTSGVERCLEPTNPVTEWDTMDIGSEAVRFDITPKALQISGTASGVNLWAVNSLGPVIMAYDDTLAKVRPTPTVPMQVPFDPVSGRNSQFAISWPAVSTGTEYDVEIHADEQCTALILSAPAEAPDIAYRPPDIASPAWVVTPGQLTAGKDYYVRLRVRNQQSGDQVRGLWSSPVRFSVAQGVPVRATYSGPVLTAPGFGATVALLKPGFTWAMVPGVSEYELVLAEDAGFTRLVAGTPARIKGNAWQCASELNYGTTYFWRVRVTAPVAGDWSQVVVASFTTVARPESSPSSAPLPSPQQASQPATAKPALPSSPPPVPAPEPLTPLLLVWLVVGIFTILIAALVVLIVRTRR